MGPLRTAALLGALWLSAASSAFAAGRPDAITPDGGRYYGPLVNGRLHGRGRIEWENGVTYEGHFAKGLMSGHGRYAVPEREVYEGSFKQGFYWGQGELRYPDGRTYRGEFVRDDFHGKGRLVASDGDIYEGDFSKGEIKRGVYTRDGIRYEGEFLHWRFNGSGRFTDARGNVWEGGFVNGMLEGPGKATSENGTYEGDFKHSQFHGQGVLRLANGDVYRGAFEHGLYHGQGTLTYAAVRPDGRREQSGTWVYGTPDGQAAERKQVRTNVEAALYAQKELLDKALASLKARELGRINLYLLAIAGDGSQEVFRREVDFVHDEFARRFGTGGRALALVNSRNTVDSAPMATVTSIRRALDAIAARMDREQDILFLFLTSHGSREHELSLGLDGVPLPGLTAKELARLLKESGIRWKVVLVSACYSGGFIDALHDDRTLVIAAARRDRRSFGCADENDFTYFGRAFFKEALPGSQSFQDAFHKAEALVAEWERKDLMGAEDGHSLPQMSTSGAIEAHLKRWWAQAPR